MSFRPSFARALVAFAAPLVFGCSETTVEVELHSLQASGEVAFVCRQPNGEGIDRSQCPDFEALGHKIFALVTQTSTEEIAVIDTRNAEVVDIDPSVPGYSFLRVPSRPGHIVSSPGGAATFVGITGVGKTGITAIPTTCIGAPAADESARDVTSFASCHLPSTPGDIAVLVAPDEGGVIRESCEPGSPVQSEFPPRGASADDCVTNGAGERVCGERFECGANLTREHLDADGNTVGPVGRRKLAVALPYEVDPKIAIIDAQWLLDREPGSFEECRIEASLPLEVDLGPADLEQVIGDPELDPRGCTIDRPIEPPRPATFEPRPAGFALADDTLYVADQQVPVVHVVDVSNPCSPRELPPLRPMSFLRPDRVVTTSRVAASPLTPDGKRYVYAIDEYDQPASSIMAFDVSPGSTNRTPLVRPGSLRIPEPPDRLQLSSDIADVAFALRDLPAADPVTGVAESGVHCDPDPRISSGSPPTQHRPTSDKTRGAQPRLLRGLFGLAMMTSGQVAIIDVDDFDGPCRRPITTNPFGNEDFRGCSSDTALPPFLTLPDGMSPEGSPTVTNEVSCNMVRPHRFRSAGLGVTTPTLGPGAPSLVSFPVFTRPRDVDLPPQHQPKMLAVPFEPAKDGLEPPPPEVYIGTTLYAKGRLGADLPTDPNASTLASLTLPFAEPRAIPPSESVSVIYEAAITDAFPRGSIVLDGSEMRVEDPSAEYCSKGVYDLEMLAELGAELGVAEAERDVFARQHADLIEITSELLPVDDSYWLSERLLKPLDEGGECGLSRSTCVETFGDYDADEPNPNRELAILDAYQDRLVVEPRAADDPVELRKHLECCFPQGVEHRVRVQQQWVIAGSASGLRHDVVARRVGDRFECERSCEPRHKFAKSRVFEIATTAECTSDPGSCAVGPAVAGDPCRYDAGRSDGGLNPAAEADQGAARCIHSGLTARFAIYRGLSPSVRGMRFSWETTGGFRALLTSIASVSPAVLPQNVQYVPELQRIAIVDGATLGLTLVSLDSLRVERPWPVY